jgi:hypothetical protein
MKRKSTQKSYSFIRRVETISSRLNYLNYKQFNWKTRKFHTYLVFICLCVQRIYIRELLIAEFALNCTLLTKQPIKDFMEMLFLENLFLI